MPRPAPASVGLTTVEAETLRLGGHECLIVSRFDRVVGEDGEVRRIHQEDLCQALDIDPGGARGRAKYEGTGGPRSVKRPTARSLRRGSPCRTRPLRRDVTYTVRSATQMPTARISRCASDPRRVAWPRSMTPSEGAVAEAAEPGRDGGRRSGRPR